jgi:hypothetical protein
MLVGQRFVVNAFTGAGHGLLRFASARPNAYALELGAAAVEASNPRAAAAIKKQ